VSDVYIIGIDMIPFQRYPELTVSKMGAMAALLALDDCGLALTDMQGLYCGNVMQAHLMVGQRVLREIGETGMPVVNTANACATGATAFREAFLAIKSGMSDVVLAVGVEQMGRGLLTGPGRPNGFVEEGLIGSTTTPAMFAQIGMEHSHLYGTTFEQFAKVSVKNHRHSVLNPKAASRRETPLAEVMASEMIAYPNTKLMCSINTDGAAAAVLASEATVRRMGLVSRAVRIRACELTSSPFTVHGDALTDFNEVTRLCARAAFDRAQLGPKDLDVIELHDCFATAELLHYENLGICADGEAGRLIDTGYTALGGELPVNVSGGLLSKGHPLGATGIANLYEVALHLRGEAGSRQVEGATIGLTHVVGGAPEMGSCCVINILQRPG
jgi:acetyl-CoA acyltransferase